MTVIHTFISIKISLIKKAGLLILATCMFFTGIAQKVTVKGHITDEKGSPAEFVGVSISGAHIGTTTDSSGFFILQNVTLPQTITYSRVGFTAGKLTLNKKDAVDHILITMKADVTELSTVTIVTTALGVKKQPKELGYASATISSTTLSAGKATDAAAYLSGKVSSVSISTETPVRIRGTRSLSADETHTVSKSLGDVDRKSSTPTTPEPTKPTPASAYSAGSSATHAGMLTAGEVNDFKKWKMWEDYSKTDFESYSTQWGLFAIHRYSVQLQNREFIPVVGEKIFLIDRESGDTIWAAVSDNTGKAELWSEFTVTKKIKQPVIVIGHEKTDYPAVTFIQGINRITLNRNCNIADGVQIAFLVDATGSMQDEINYLKEETEDVLQKVAARNPVLQLQTAAIFYRDKGDAYLTKMHPFSTGIKTTVDFIKQQNADGGGDYPESVDAGLDSAVQKLQWNENARTKIIFLLMDAPPHVEAKDKMAELIIMAAAKGIRIVPVACSGTDKITEFIMRSIALATNGTYLFLTDDSGIGNGHIKPTTDEFKVEHLNDLMQRTIEQMCFANSCSQEVNVEEPVTPFTNTLKVNVYPNPTNGPVTLETSKKLKEIFVTDFTGKILMRIEGKNKSGRYHFDLSGFPSAVYLIRYITEDGAHGTEQVVLMR